MDSGRWEVVADGTVELGAMFEEGAAAERVVSLRPLKGASGTYSQTVRLEVRAWPSWKGLETLHRRGAAAVGGGQTVGILGVAAAGARWRQRHRRRIARVGRGSSRRRC